VPRTRLTELTVARVKSPKEGRLELWDTALPAFGLRLTANGRRSWIVAIRKPGARHPVRVKLGEPPLMGLTTARDKARTMLQDPGGMIEQHERAKLESVQVVIEQFIERHHKPRNRRWQEVRRILLRELADWHRPIRDIGRRDVLEVLDRAIDRGTPYAANRLLAYVRKMFNWCLERGIVDTSPVANSKAPAKERSRDRVLEDEELAAIWSACDGLGWPWWALVRLLIVTGQRRDEVAHMAWPDLDLERRLWTLPRELTKADRAHEVPLSELAVEILAGMPRLGDRLVFPANRHGSRNPVSGFSGMKRRLDTLCRVTGWRLHDLRRTAASGMARLGHPPHVVTAILNHSPGSTMGITAVYNRHRYADEKRAALDAWSREIERIIGRNDAEVISLLGQSHK
jgi:integrase